MTTEFKQPALMRCALQQSVGVSVAYYQGQYQYQADFSRAVACTAGALNQQPELAYALYYEEAYPFAVMLFALWHAGKTVWVAANNHPASADYLRQQGCCLLGHWAAGQATPLSEAVNPMQLSALDLQHTSLTLLTSGSTGLPKPIHKQLWQLQCEIDTLEQQWGIALAKTQVLATVSHQHIYGLLFKVLWPLTSGRCFYSKTYLSPESLLNAAGEQPSIWIASPAQLKRLDQCSPWPAISHLKAIFSSGGRLDTVVAKQIQHESGLQLIDIYGSSETGGIAWRKPVSDARWQLFSGINIVPSDHQQYLLYSPYLPADMPYLLNDQLKMDEKGRFSLLGRSDRIVKIAEKRLSLNELEHVLQQSDSVSQAHCRLWNGQRERIAAVIVLTPQGLAMIKTHGKNSLIKQLKRALLHHFEAVALPKKWLFINELPLSAQGKIDYAKIDGLWSLDRRIFPQLQFLNLQDDGSVALSLIIQADLSYFAGHFPGQPILPGVTQLAWAEKYGQLFFPITQPFSSMEVIKFKKIIRPDEQLTLRLRWQSDSGKLYFDFSSAIESHSSGRLVYKSAV